MENIFGVGRADPAGDAWNVGPAYAWDGVLLVLAGVCGFEWLLNLGVPFGFDWVPERGVPLVALCLGDEEAVGLRPLDMPADLCLVLCVEGFPV